MRAIKHPKVNARAVRAHGVALHHLHRSMSIFGQSLSELATSPRNPKFETTWGIPQCNWRCLVTIVSDKMNLCKQFLSSGSPLTTSKQLARPQWLSKRRPPLHILRAHNSKNDGPGLNAGHKVSNWAYNAGFKSEVTLEDFLGDRYRGVRLLPFILCLHLTDKI